MKRGLRHVALLAALLVAGSSFAPAARRRHPRRPSGTDWKALLTTVYDAWSTRNAKNASPLYAPDADLVFYDVAPLKYQGWAAYAEGAQRRFLDGAARVAFTPNDDLRATERGNVAWTTLTVHLAASFRDGRTLDLDCRHTAIWEKRRGRWLIVHEHLSAPLPGS